MYNQQWEDGRNDIANDGADFSRRSDIDTPRSSNPTDFFSSNEDAERKILALRTVLDRDPSAADLKWSLFVAASNTYRHDSCLMPFPPMFTNKECKDIEALVK